MKLKKIILAFSLFLLLFLIGGEFHYRELFPYGVGLRNKLLFLKKPEVKNTEICTRLEYRKKKFEFFLSKVKSGGSIDYLIIGDSVAKQAQSPKLFDLKYEIIASDGATVGCLIPFIDYVKQIKPKVLIIYLGGNDADGQGIQNYEEASKTYLEFIKNFKNDYNEVYAIGVNIGAPWKRDIGFVRNFNKLIKEGINELNSMDVKYIESFVGLNFEKSTKEEIAISDITYDGEHLRYQGYVNWFRYIDEHVNGGIYQK